MHVQISDRHVVTSDPLQYILNEACQRGEKSKNAGEEYLHPIAYFTSLDGLITSLFDRYLKESEAKNLQELRKAIKEAVALVEHAAMVLRKAA